MITFFTTAKAFRGHNAVIQRNALGSWVRLEPRPEILLFGDEEGSAEVAREMGLRHVPEVAVNEYGTPLIGDIFEQGQRLAANRLVCYINADIMLLPDFLRAAKFVSSRYRNFLMAGQRTDLDQTQAIAFDHPNWRENLLMSVDEHGERHGQHAIDYFLFPKGALGKVPMFAIGRWFWDNWLLFEARRRHYPLVDATESVLAIHQNHDYGHVKAQPPGHHFDWPESQVNLRLAGGAKILFQLDDSSHRLALHPPSFVITRLRGKRQIDNEMQILYYTNPGIKAVRAVARGIRRLLGADPTKARSN